jgi:hypothetical protein
MKHNPIQLTFVMVLTAVIALWLATTALAQQSTPTPTVEQETEQEVDATPAATEETQTEETQTEETEGEETQPAEADSEEADSIEAQATEGTAITNSIPISVGPRISATATLVSTDLDPDATPFVSINLEAGATIDPFLVSVNGGGPVDVSGLGGDCVGYVAVAPTASVNWLGGADFVEAFFYSDHDPILVVQTPNGDYLCNDDASDVLIDPMLNIQDAALGTYNIWVGSFDPGQLVPGFLVLTANPATNIGTFDPGALVQRESIPVTAVGPSDVRTTEVPTITTSTSITSASGASAARSQVALPTLTIDTPPLTSTLTLTGTVPAFDLRAGDAVCTGYLSEEPSYRFSLEDETDNLRIYFEGLEDTSLVVVGPDEQVYCNDDLVAGENLNPLIDILNPDPGVYVVTAGRFDMEEAVIGELVITTGTALSPTILAPYQEPDQE